MANGNAPTACDHFTVPAPLASVIVSTYNQPAWLALCLSGFAHQDRHDFELIVVDDGSCAETRALLAARRAGLPFHLQHVWQEDRGFRKCRALNLGILAARSDYLVFTDGDCVPRRDFVSAHLRLRARGSQCTGGLNGCNHRLPLAASAIFDGTPDR